MTPYTGGHKVTLQLSYCWTDSVNAVHSWSKSSLFVDFKHMSVGVTTGVTRFCNHISDVRRYSVTTIIRKRRDTLVGILHGLWTVWSSRSVNLTIHLQVRPELRNCGAIPLFLLHAFIACTRISLPLPLPVPITLQRAALDHSQYRYPTPNAIWRSQNTYYVTRL
jgi:hypothetical protein